MASRGLERRLSRAAAAGDSAAVERLLAERADPGCQVRDRYPPPFSASFQAPGR